MVNKMSTRYHAKYTIHNEQEELQRMEIYETYSKDNLIEYVLRSCGISHEKAIEIITEECLTHLKYTGHYFLEINNDIDTKTVSVKVVE